ncbi:MAG: GNAT family N-acetyltransferase [Ignavibacterium sp.]|nr:MAG: GNAT family N-acetyltransferase [Ignavibacterium sp.]
MTTLLQNIQAEKSERNLTVYLVGTDLEFEWEDFLTTHPESTIYHHPLWLKVIEKESGQEVLKLICTNDENEILGILLLQETKGIPFGLGGVSGSRRLSSLPRTPIGGPLATDEYVAAKLINGVINLVSENPDKLLQIKSYATDLDKYARFLYKHFWREIYIKEIPPYPDEIRYGSSRNHSAIKRAVNKALRSGVRYRLAETEDDLRQWYNLYLDTMRFHTSPARSFKFFIDLWKYLRPKGFMNLLLAELEEGKNKATIAGNVLFYYNGTVTYAFNGSSRHHFEYRSNDLLHMQAIVDAQKDGYREYNLGEVARDHSGLAAYKKKWGSKVMRLYHYYYPNPPQLEKGPLDVEIVSGLKNKIWRRLPLCITAKIGKMVYKKL